MTHSYVFPVLMSAAMKWFEQIPMPTEAVEQLHAALKESDAPTPFEGSQLHAGIEETDDENGVKNGEERA